MSRTVNSLTYWQATLIGLEAQGIRGREVNLLTPECFV